MFPQEVTIQMLNAKFNANMGTHLGIEFTEVGDIFLSAKMPVDHRTRQPFGVLHGGASVVLAETIGSVASNMLVDQTKQFCSGLEINANHVKSVQAGFVFGKAIIVHFGKKTHVWDVRITNEANELICISRLTVAVIDKKV